MSTEKDRREVIASGAALDAILAGHSVRDSIIEGSLVPPVGHKFRGIDLQGSLVQGEVNLWEAEISESFNITGTTIEGNLDCSSMHLRMNADWMNVCVQGAIELSSATIEGTLALSGAQIDGRIQLDGAQLLGHIYFDFSKPPCHIAVTDRAMADRIHLHAPTVPLAFGLEASAKPRHIKASGVFAGYDIELVGRRPVAVAQAGRSESRLTLGQIIKTLPSCPVSPGSTGVVCTIDFPKESGAVVRLTVFLEQTGIQRVDFDHVHPIGDAKF